MSEKEYSKEAVDALRQRVMDDFNIEEDELKVLFPDDDSFLEYCKNTLSRLNEISDVEGGDFSDEELKDNYRLSDRHKRELDRIRSDKKAEEERIKKCAEEAKEAQNKARYASLDQSNLPKEDQVSYKDFVKSASALDELSDEELDAFSDENESSE